MKFRLETAFLATMAAICVISCKSEFDAVLNSNDIDVKYDAAFSYYNKGKYSRAADIFESLSVLTNGTDKDDTVQFYWGMSNYKFKDYFTAETNFEKFLENYPRSPFSPEASFLRIDCLYRQTLRYELDQAPTYKAITAISEYVIEYPKSPYAVECKEMLDDLNERLQTKAFEGARLYYHMEDYQASRVALQNVLKADSENMYREQILYLVAMSSYKYAFYSVPAKQKERYLTFTDDYFYFIGELPDSKYRKELDNLYQRSQKALGKYSGDIDKIKEKDFEKERKLLEQNESEDGKLSGKKKK